MKSSRNLVILICFFLSQFAESQNARSSGRSSRGSDKQNSTGKSSGGKKAYVWELQGGYNSGRSKAVPQTVTGQPALNNEFETTSSVYSLKLGRSYSSGLYLGAIVSNRSDVQGSVTTQGQSQALGFGYLGESGASVRFYYHMGEKYGEYSDGKGGSAELGYYLKLGSQFSLGFLLTHQQIQYFKNPLIANFQNWSASWSHPVITLAYSTR